MKKYLGDGVYINIDECDNIELTTENGIEVTNRTILEPEVIHNLLQYIKSLESE